MKFEDQDEYKKVVELIRELDADGMIERFQGACVASSEVIQAILHARGVKSRFLECNALIANAKNNGNSIHFIGFNTIVPLKQNEVDTHVVVLVEAAIPFIIDASIGHKMGSGKFVVISPLSSSDPDIISEASFHGALVTYRVKKNIRYATIHQKSLVDRMNEEQKTKSDVGMLMNTVKILLFIGGINMIANATIIILKILHP